MNDNLRREASGIWNELTIRHSILKRPGGKDIWAGRLPDIQALTKMHDIFLKTGDEEAAKREIADALKSIHAIDGKTTYEEAYKRQYALFQISDKTGSDTVEFVQKCHGETGLALPADQIKVHGHRPEGPFYWLTHESFHRILQDHNSGFQSKGFADHEIGEAIMTALTTGSMRQPKDGDTWHYHRYHDPKKNCVLGLWVKPGEKPGQIVDASMKDSTIDHWIRSPDGLFKWISCKDANALIPLRREGFRSHGISDADIPSAIMTAMAAGKRLPFHDDADGWAVYRFQFKDVLSELTIRIKQDASGEIKDFAMPVTHDDASVQYSIADEVLAGLIHSELEKLAAACGMDGRALIGTIIDSSNLKRISLENPGMGVYRAVMKNGELITMLAKIENGEIKEICKPSPFDIEEMFRHFPKLEIECKQLQKEGWVIGVGAKGGGTCCDLEYKKIILDLSLFANPVECITRIAHEQGHALYQIGQADTEKKYVQECALDEGNALFCEYKLLGEVTDQDVKNQLWNLFDIQPYGKEGAKIYAQWQKDCRSANGQKPLDRARKTAQSAYGEIFEKLHPSLAPEGVTYKKMWETYYRTTFGSEAKTLLMEQLRQQ